MTDVFNHLRLVEINFARIMFSAIDISVIFGNISSRVKLVDDIFIDGCQRGNA